MTEKSKNNVSIVFDCDGILTDIWTPVEDRLKHMSRSELSAYANGSDTIDSLEAFAKNFNFNNYIKDFRMSALTAAQHKLVTDQWDVSAFEFPFPMYHSTDNRWVADSCVPVINRISFRMWAEWFNVLTNRGVDVILHTHVYGQSLADARRRWFKAEIKPIAPKVRLKMDIGAKKSKSSGTIVVEDNIDNLIVADAKFKILRTCFHNQVCCIPGTNENIAVRDTPIYTYSSFFTLQYFVSLFVQGKTVAQAVAQLERMYR